MCDETLAARYISKLYFVFLLILIIRRITRWPSGHGDMGPWGFIFMAISWQSNGSSALGKVSPLPPQSHTHINRTMVDSWTRELYGRRIDERKAGGGKGQDLCRPTVRDAVSGITPGSTGLWRILAGFFEMKSAHSLRSTLGHFIRRIAKQAYSRLPCHIFLRYFSKIQGKRSRKTTETFYGIKLITRW